MEVRQCVRAVALVISTAVCVNGHVTARADSGTSLVRVRTVGPFVIVPVALEAVGIFPFLLDTGSATTVIDAALASDLALPQVGSTTLMTSSGPVVTPLVKASLSFGAIRVDDLEVVQLPLATLGAVERGTRGVLGQDVLRRSNWLLDYRKRTIEQDLEGALAERVPGERLEMRWSDERPAVTAAFGETPPVDLVLDSAASGLVLFNALFNAAPGESDRKSTRLKSLSAEIEAPVVTADVLQIGAIVFARPTAALVTLEGEARSGLLPTSMFERVYFDNQRSRVVVVRRP